MRTNHLATVMPALVPAIRKQDMDGRDKPGHDSGEMTGTLYAQILFRYSIKSFFCAVLRLSLRWSS